MGWLFKLNGEFVEEPIGFDAIEFTAKRLESHGVDQPFSTDLTFDGRSAILLKERFDQSFINDNPTFEIISDQKVNGYPWSFLGYVDMSTYLQTNNCNVDSFEVTVGILEDNFRERFKNRSDVEVDLLTEKDLDQNAIPQISFRSVRLHTQDIFLIAGWNTQNDTTESFSNPDQISIVWPLYLLNNDFKGQFGTGFDVQGFTYSNTNVILVNNGLVERSFKINCGKIKATINNTGEPALFQLFSVIYRDDGSFFSVTTLDSVILTTGASGVLEYNFSDYDIVLDVGYRFQIYMNGDSTNPSTTFSATWLTSENYITITENNAGQYASNVYALTVEEYLRRLLYILTGDPDGLISDFFSEENNGCEWNNILTTGLYIRNALTIEQFTNGCSGDVPQEIQFGIKTTWKKIFSDLDKIFCLGWGYDYQQDGTWKIRVESRAYFYQNIQIANCAEPDQIKKYTLSDKLKNNLRIGFSDKWKNIAVSGACELHTDRSYFVKNKAVSNGSSSTEDMRSDIICSGYAIEFSRRLQFLRNDSGSSDRPNDYEHFLIWINREEVTIEDIENSGYQFFAESGSVTFAPGTVSYGSNFIISSNAPIDRIYNIRHTPARIAIRQWKWIGMHTYGLSDADAKLFYQTGEYFTTYSSEIADDDCIESQPGEIFENQDIFKDTMKPEFQKYILKPIGLDLQYPQSLCEFQSMGFPGLGYVRIEQAGSVYYGYLEESSNQPVDPQNGLTNFKLILANNAPLLGDYSDDYSDDYSN